MPAKSDAPAFSPEHARFVLAEVGTAIGLDTSGAGLLRLGENAIFRVGETVVRISRDADTTVGTKEVEVSRWLADKGIRAAEAIDVRQPIVVAGHSTTLWRYLAGSADGATTEDLAVALKQLHGMNVSTAPPALPECDLFGRVGERLDLAEDVDPSVVGFLRAEFARLQDQIDQLVYQGDRCVIHGDAHIKNLMVDSRGWTLIDFERFAVGYPELDLCVTAAEYSVGLHTDAAYRAFCDAYGRDLRDWSGFETLRQVNLLKMTTWLMQNIAHHEEVAAEFETRVETLRSGTAPRAWRGF